MSIWRITKLVASWIVAWVIGGAVIGIVMALGDTGHVSVLNTVFILVVAGLIFGFVGGVFAPLFVWIVPYLPNRQSQVGLAAVLGTLSGLLGIYVADLAVGITHSFTVGSLTGAITGLICGALSVSEYRPRKTPPNSVH